MNIPNFASIGRFDLVLKAIYLYTGLRTSAPGVPLCHYAVFWAPFGYVLWLNVWIIPLVHFCDTISDVQLSTLVGQPLKFSILLPWFGLIAFFALECRWWVGAVSKHIYIIMY